MNTTEKAEIISTSGTAAPIFRRDTVQQLALESLAKNLQLAREDVTAVMVERDQLLATLRVARRMLDDTQRTPIEPFLNKLALIDAVLEQYADLTHDAENGTLSPAG